MWSGKGDNRRQSIKIVDFGLATIVKDDSSYVSTKHVVGTNLYSSLEKISGGAVKYDSRDDLWGLGCVFLELTAKSRLTTCLAWFEHDNSIRETKEGLLQDCHYPDSKVSEAIEQT